MDQKYMHRLYIDNDDPNKYSASISICKRGQIKKHEIGILVKLELCIPLESSFWALFNGRGLIAELGELPHKVRA